MPFKRPAAALGPLTVTDSCRLTAATSPHIASLHPRTRTTLTIRCTGVSSTTDRHSSCTSTAHLSLNAAAQVTQPLTHCTLPHILPHPCRRRSNTATSTKTKTSSTGQPRTTHRHTRNPTTQRLHTQPHASQPLTHPHLLSSCYQTRHPSSRTRQIPTQTSPPPLRDRMARPGRPAVTWMGALRGASTGAAHTAVSTAARDGSADWEGDQ